MTEISLTTLTDEMRAEAVTEGALRASRVLKGEGRLRQVAIVLLPGGELPEHGNPGEARLIVMSGSVRFIEAATEVTHVLSAGDYFVVPDALHSVEADAESLLLLSFAPVQ